MQTLSGLSKVLRHSFRSDTVKPTLKTLSPKIPLGSTPYKSQYVQRPKGSGADTKILKIPFGAAQSVRSTSRVDLINMIEKLVW